MCGAALFLSPASAGAHDVPPGVIEIEAPEPWEISGVAAVPGGYAVVGDETHHEGRTWPDGGYWNILPEVRGPESLDVGFGPDGEEVWFVLGEDNRTLSDNRGTTHQFSIDFLPKNHRHFWLVHWNWDHFYTRIGHVLGYVMGGPKFDLCTTNT